LAVRPATKAAGVAVLDKTTLLFSAVHGLAQRGTTGKAIDVRLSRLRTKLDELIAFYRPMVMVCEEVSARRLAYAPSLAVIQTDIAATAHEHGLPLKRMSMEAVLRALTPPEQMKKKDVTAILARIYPHLYYHLAPFPSPQWKYWQPMMEAIGLGLTFFLQEEQRNGR
jgi:Holliday junction resolvasome RuvABC endonuclease subunit